MSAPFATLAPGVWPILPTPFRGPELEVDTAALRRVVEHARATGATGVVALGVLGEAARLTAAERADVLDAVLAAAGDLPVVAGVSALPTAPAVEEASRAVAAGAHAVMALVPTADAGRLAEHLTIVSERSGAGVVVQDHPASTGVRIPIGGLVQALQQIDIAVAVKAEAPPTPAGVAAIAAGTGLPVFGGLGGVGLLDELAAGSAGVMTGFALPEVLKATVAAWQAGGMAAARPVLAPYLPLIVCEAQEGVSLAIRKELLRRRGLIAEAAVRPPGAALPAWADRVLTQHLAALEVAGLLPAAHDRPAAAAPAQ